jgi:hypothetical protein
MRNDILGGIAAAAFWVVMPQAANAQWTGEMTITSAFVQDSDVLVVYTAGGGNDGCAANAWVIVAANEDRRARLWATVLTALSLGKKVSLWFNGGCGTFGYHQASAVQINS